MSLYIKTVTGSFHEDESLCKCKKIFNPKKLIFDIFNRVSTELLQNSGERVIA
ncbi:MAG: hypothetical protein AB1521_09565 [Bacteroidota bacterium]